MYEVKWYTFSMIRFAFFGSSEFSIHVADALLLRGLAPTVVVTTPDKPYGRGLVVSPNLVKAWAQKNGIPVLDPAKFDDAFIEKLKGCNCEVFVVASYGKIIPEKVLDAAPKRTLNVHPSLLPSYRGASPIQSAIVDDAKDTGVTIMRLDSEMDHGPIVAAKKVRFDEWPTYEKAEEKLGSVGGSLLATILPDWMQEKAHETPQDHSQATYTKKIKKEAGLLDLADISPDAPVDRAYLAFQKIQAYHAWPGTYFFTEKNGKKIRVKVSSASWKDQKLAIEKVIPESKKEMPYSDFMQSIAENR